MSVDLQKLFHPNCDTKKTKNRGPDKVAHEELLQLDFAYFKSTVFIFVSVRVSETRAPHVGANAVAAFRKFYVEKGA